MSRKSRHRKDLELIRERSVDELHGHERTTVHALTGDLHNALEAIISGLALTHGDDIPAAIMDAAINGLPEFADEPDELTTDLFGKLDDYEGEDDADTDLEPDLEELGTALGGIAFTTRILARALIAQALGRQPTRVDPIMLATPIDADDDANAILLDQLSQALLPSNLPGAVRPSRGNRKAALGEADSLVREVGLEEFDVLCRLATDRDGTTQLVAFPLSPESAHVALLEFLVDRAEAFVFNLEPLLGVERDASSWEFARWSASPPPQPGPTEAANFSRSVREQEYSLADRPTISLGTSVMSEIAADDSFAELFPRQHRLAGALAASFVDIFECVALHGSRSTLRSLRDGRTYEVHEHTDPVEYDIGWIAAGRLLPFDGELHLRSPSMIFVQLENPEVVGPAVAALDTVGVTLPPALALERCIASVLLNVSVPRTVKPARSRAEAREGLILIRRLLAEAEIEHGQRLRRDATLDAFIAALEQQAEVGVRHVARPPAHGRKKAKRRR